VSLGKNLPSKVVLRKDKTSIYITQDIYLAKYKFEKYNLDKSIYVIGSEQDLYMQQLFAVLKKLGFSFAKNMQHFSYGMIYLPSGKMKSREGKVIDWDNFLYDVIQNAKNIVKTKWPDLSQKILNKRAEIIAKASIIYFIFKYDPKKDFVFDTDKSLSFEGNSGAYLLYTYARLNSLIKRINRFKLKQKNKITKIYSEDEENLLRFMGHFNFKIDGFIEKQNLHLFVKYFLDLANIFNSTYAKQKFITNKNEIANRLIYLKELKRLFNFFFEIIGIKPLERM